MWFVGIWLLYDRTDSICETNHTCAAVLCAAAANPLSLEGYDDPRLGALFVDRWVRTPNLQPSPSQCSLLKMAGQGTVARLQQRPTHPNKLMLQPTALHMTTCSPSQQNPSGNSVRVVCRVLSGARAVQVLGRINRPAPHKEGCLLVVDFVNSAGAIREAFGEYYGTTSFCTGEKGGGG